MNLFLSLFRYFVLPSSYQFGRYLYRCSFSRNFSFYKVGYTDITNKEYVVVVYTSTIPTNDSNMTFGGQIYLHLHLQGRIKNERLISDGVLKP